MQLRRFANTDLRVSPLGLGTVKLGRNQGVKYPEEFRIPDDRDARQLLGLARDLGINLLDTAPAYGNSEARLGKLLKGQRDHWVIATKVGEEFEEGQSRFEFSAAHTRLSVERSLRRLNTDYLDIVLVHSDGDDRRIVFQEDVLDTLAAMQREGWIRAYGMSTKTVDGGLLAAERCDAVMATYNLDYRDELPVLDYCAANNRAVLVKKAFASGHIIDRSEAGDRSGHGAAEASLEFVYAHPGVTSVIIGTINPDHLRSNAACAAALTRTAQPGLAPLDPQ